MNGIRVNTGALKIEVNDNGEYIILHFEDHTFPNRYFSMLDRIQKRCDKATEEAKAIEGQYGKGTGKYLRASFALDEELHRYIMAEVDSLFGAETCRKVFGDIVPGVELFDDFISQLMPYFEQYAKERRAKISKYSAARTGNV